MTRTNYRVLAYYETAMYDTECYIMIINARSDEELEIYLTSIDLDYKILDEEQCSNIYDIQLADSILIDGTRIYKDNEAYNSVIKLFSIIY